MYETILVPLDGSPFGEQVLPLAAGLARAQEATIELLRVHVPILADYGTEAFMNARQDDALREDASAYLDGVAAGIEGARAQRTTVVLADDRSVAHAICHEADSHASVLVAMTTHGRTGLTRSLVGSVADGVLRHTTRPLLLWRSTGRTPPLPAHVAHVLVALDGSEHAEAVLPHAAALADAFRARVTLLRLVGRSLSVRDDMVALPIYPLFTYGSAVAVADTAATQAAAQEARRYLERIAGQLRRERHGLAVNIRVNVQENVGAGILSAVAETGADLVAMTTHGRGMTRLVTGSTVDTVMRGRYGATLLLRPPGQR